jgi:CO/xanthine dehydrogenase Mo-binding subunit
MQTRIVGTSATRREAEAKLRGTARYVDDMVLPGMLFGATVRTKGPRGRLLGIRFEGAIPWDEFVVATAADIPGKNVIALINDDQPCLVPVGGVFSHPEEPVVLLAHPDRGLLERARDAVVLEVEPLDAVFTIDDALAAKTVVWGADNIFKTYTIEKGSVAEAFARQDVIVIEGTYTTPAQEQLYIEPNGMIAIVDQDDAVTVMGSLQCPYYVQKAIMGVFGVEAERARVVQLETGGGFGGKEEYPSMIGAHAALLARKAKLPVKIIYDRGEDMAATTKRHPSRTRHRTAVMKDGTIVGMDIDFVVDGGAYSTLSQVVLSRGTIHAAGPYEVPNLRIFGRAVATNAPPHGAFRGFGAPQSIFALERHLDRVARALGMSPEALRRKNFVKKGGTLATGQLVRDDVDMNALLTKALDAAHYHEKLARSGKPAADGTRHGVGMACFLHGTGFTGSGEKYLASVVGAEVMDDGRVRILASSTEIGQGTQTVFAQIAAESLGVDLDTIEVAQPDTKDVPNSGPTVASRTCTIVGKLVVDAATAILAKMQGAGFLPPAPYSPAAFREAAARCKKELGSLRAKSTYEAPPWLTWDETTFRGDAYGSFSWAVYVADVAVDPVTYEARVVDFVALQEVGKVINPRLAEGQIEGGVAQAIGFALYENVHWKDGRMSNNRMTDYIVPTAADVPPIRVLFEEAPYPFGAYGAKGIGELPMDGPAPAITNAIFDATGVDLVSIPASPEAIFRAMEASGV